MKREAEKVEHTTVPPSGIGIRTSVAIAWGSLRQADLHTRHFYWGCSCLAEVRLAVRPCCPMDRRDARTGA